MIISRYDIPVDYRVGNPTGMSYLFYYTDPPPPPPPSPPGDKLKLTKLTLAVQYLSEQQQVSRADRVGILYLFYYARQSLSPAPPPPPPPPCKRLVQYHFSECKKIDIELTKVPYLYSINHINAPNNMIIFCNLILNPFHINMLIGALHFIAMDICWYPYNNNNNIVI